MRTGPSTSKVLSSVPSAEGCALHPASSRAAQAASEIQPSLCARVIYCVRRLGTAIAGSCNVCARPSFLSEIYERAQPEVPGTSNSWRYMWDADAATPEG